MEITLIQALLITLIAFITGLDFWLEGFFIFRPIIVAPLVGAVLGDLNLGLVVGGSLELMFAGLTPAGGVQPPNPIMAAIMTVVLAHTSGIEVDAAIALGFPFSLLMQQVILLIYSFNSVNMKRFDQFAREGDIDKVARLCLKTTIFVGAVYAAITFLSVYAAQDVLSNLVNMIPEWSMHGLELAGGVLPAIGFAMLLKILLKSEYVAFLFLGFVLISYGVFTSILPVAIIGGSIAAILFFNNVNSNNRTIEVASEKEDYTNGI